MTTRLISHADLSKSIIQEKLRLRRFSVLQASVRVRRFATKRKAMSVSLTASSDETYIFPKLEIFSHSETSRDSLFLRYSDKLLYGLSA